MKPTIRLTGENKLKGELFTRLAKDLFFSLGYDELRLNIHKTGREIDIQGKHRLENRFIVAECKAHQKKIGGDDLNKFYGVLTRERQKKQHLPVVGYFVSLNGFTESGVEQEEDSNNLKTILIDSGKIIKELINGRVLIPTAEAAVKAGECVSYHGLANLELQTIELIVHSSGYVYLVIFSLNKVAKYFSLIHADGVFIADEIKSQIVDLDKKAKGDLGDLEYLHPPATSLQVNSNDVFIKYNKWISEECGYIQLDGLPADTELSATRLKLEKLFVPLKLIPINTDENISRKTDSSVLEPKSIGVILQSTRHISILAMPGGGKSTLLKRMASSYAYPERRKHINDDLPKKTWQPIILRCRELRDKAHKPLFDLLVDTGNFACLTDVELKIFKVSLHERLQSGEVLLLVDGLDEIASESGRQSFANNLRTFISIFPKTYLIVTSRPAGYRVVAGVVATSCKQFELSTLGENEVVDLCNKWHVEVVGDSDKVVNESIQLAKSIWSNISIRKLVENPLLLTTLLVVKRWMQQLPKSRVTLYREAIKVLVRTWNVEGYEPLDEDEALAQLSYVACAMKEKGIQQIGHDELLLLLKQSRVELDAELQFTKVAPHEFIKRIEYRSSLIIQTGHDLIDGSLQPIYEFRHLTFQEYLAARGYVLEQYPNRNLGLSCSQILKQYLYNETWQEVITIASALSGRKAEGIIQIILDGIEQIQTYKTAPEEITLTDRSLLLTTLNKCLVDEVIITPAILDKALTMIIGYREHSMRKRSDVDIPTLLAGRFGERLRCLIVEGFLEGSDFADYIYAFQDMAWFDKFHADLKTKSPLLTPKLTQSFLSDLESSSRLIKSQACLNIMILAFRVRDDQLKPAIVNDFKKLSARIVSLIELDDKPIQLAACWALAWLGNKGLIDKTTPALVFNLMELHKLVLGRECSHFPLWALTSLPLLDRDDLSPDKWPDNLLGFNNELKNSDSAHSQLAAVILDWYKRQSDDMDLLQSLQAYVKSHEFKITKTIESLFLSFGDVGNEELAKAKTKLESKFTKVSK